ncbi:MAG: tRNA uridine-5-carboxymethylaminomethyl(34) synthesis GTPase MnmE [Candidatus Hydrogenedentes bacterium]|nr:tRNA uridine-5-carboxymethylaminomethyl(34) synthesis GTPase MnmE [Candidatus Hydrogenedentota bacterium]
MPGPSATNYDDTIVAISTPPGEGGVGIVRLSGPDALRIAGVLFRSSRGKSIEDRHQAVFHGHLCAPSGEVIDEVLLHLMRGPRSYTCEDVAEINGHGGAGPLNAILELVLEQGARLANPGEFTLRAFLNGRIDLVQAEAVIDQIQARTRASLQAANAAASGALSQRLHGLKDELAFALSRLEAAVDFPEDDLPELVDRALLDRLAATHDAMAQLLATSEAGRLYREGVVVAIAGRPNVGKSSLFNALLRDARAIVSVHAGTTRDRLEETITLAGVPVRLVDTAGVRDTEDEVERMGVTLARDTLKMANLVLLVLDGSVPYTQDDQDLAREIAREELPVVAVLNKCDLAPECTAPDWGIPFTAVCAMSALTGAGLDGLEATLQKLLLGGLNVSADQAMITRAHQKDSLRRAMDCVERLLAASDLSPEFLAIELQDALQALGEITGETTPDDILETIFNSFCIGK